MKQITKYLKQLKTANFHFRIWIFVICSNFLFSFQGYSQNKKLDYASVKKIINTYYDIKKLNSDSSYMIIEKKFDSLEIKVKATNDKSALLTFYKEKADFFYYENDHSEALKCINKGFEILKHYKDNRSLGLLYESLGLLHIDGVDENQSFKYILKSGELLNKYGDITDKIDCNINIGMHYKKVKEWKKAINYFLIANKNLELTTKDHGKFTYIYLFLSHCYFELNDINSGNKYLDIIEKSKSKIIPINDYSFEAQYHSVKGLKASMLGDFKTACEEYKAEKIYTSKVFRERNGYLNSYVRVRTNLALTEIENQKIKNENLINKKNLRYRNIILILGLIIIAFLLLYYFIELKNKKFKAQTNQELKISNQKLLEKNEEISKTQNTKKKFLDAITFELRAPLNSIKGYTTIVKNNAKNEKIENYKKAMAFSTEYLLSLINDMIESNVAEGLKPIILKSTPTNLKTLFLNLTNSYELNQENSGKIAFEIDEQIDEELNIDAFRLTQLFANLNYIENSLKVIENYSIFIKASLISKTEKSQKIKFEINDTGITIHKEGLQQIINYFNNNTNVIYDDFESAYGFSVLKKIFELFNTKLSINSDNEKGFLISFIIDFDTVEKAIANNETKGIYSNSNSQSIKILLVEDNKINQLLTKKILLNNGFECDVANDGKEAVDIATQNDYALILMDIMMPVMDGFEASIEIQKIKPNIPIVALTAISEEVNKGKFQECKIKKVLTKPVDIKVLCDTILDLINK